MKKETYLQLLAVLAAMVCRLAYGVQAPDELEKIGTVIQICGDTDARGVVDPPRKAGKYEYKRSCRMPDLIALSDTEWLVLYDEYSTPFSTAEWTRIVLKKTTDAGKTWTMQVINEQKKSDPDFLGNWNNSRLSQLPDGRLAISSCVRYNSQCYLFFSCDQGMNWSGPIDSKIDDAVEKALGRAIDYVESSNIMALDDGTLIMMAHHGMLLNMPANNPEMKVIDVFASINKGVSWTYRSTVRDEAHALCEPAILVDGQKLLIYCRDNYKNPYDPRREMLRGMVVMRSADGGKTWEKAHIAPKVLGQQAEMASLKDGRVLIIYRHADSQNVGCHIWVHDPKTFQGQTFTVHKIARSDDRHHIDAGGVAELSDGTILLCYSSIRRDDGKDWRYPEKRVRLAVLPPIQQWAPVNMPIAQPARTSPK